MGLATFAQLKGKTVEGMVIPDDEQLKHLQQVVLSIADDVIGYCESHNIRYALGGGSCLGAIRHQGFIPWDDDIDLNMPRADYERFLEGFSKEYSDKYFIQAPELTPERGLLLTHIRLKGTTERMHDDGDAAEVGIMIDIFPVEDTYNNFLLRNLHGIACMGMGLFQSCRRFYSLRSLYLQLAKGDAHFERTVRIKASIGKLLSFWRLSTWTTATQRVYSLCRHEDSKYVVIPSGVGHFFGEIYDRTKIVPTRTARFEGRDFCTYVDAEAYLKARYGETYLEIPPENEREIHSYLDLDFGHC